MQNDSENIHIATDQPSLLIRAAQAVDVIIHGIARLETWRNNQNDSHRERHEIRMADLEARNLQSRLDNQEVIQLTRLTLASIKDPVLGYEVYEAQEQRHSALAQRLGSQALMANVMGKARKARRFEKRAASHQEKALKAAGRAIALF